IVVLILSSCTAPLKTSQAGVPVDSIAYGQLMVRAELYFGMSKRSGGEVSESEWTAFVDSLVTPRFPDGLTVTDGRGQWRYENGRIGRERTKIIIIIYDP